MSKPIQQTLGWRPVWRKVAKHETTSYWLFGHWNHSVRFTLDVCGHIIVAKGSDGYPQRKRCRECERRQQWKANKSKDEN